VHNKKVTGSRKTRLPRQHFGGGGGGSLGKEGGGAGKKANHPGAKR